MAETNFMRKYVLTAGIAGKDGFKIGHIDKTTDEVLHVSFSIEKSNSEAANEGKVQIWNLSNDNIKILEQKNCTVELRAGYGDNLSLILVGQVSDVVTTMDNADRMTELVVVDGLFGTQSTQTSISISGTVNCKDLYSRIASEMGMSIVYGQGVTFKTMPNGFSYVGKCKNALEKVATYCGHKWTIQNNVIQIYMSGNPVANRGYVLSQETGLLSVPKRIKIEEGEDAKTGWEIMYFLNGSIGINDIVKINSKAVSGDFKVIKVNMDGDNYNGDWVCTSQVVAI